MKAMPTLEGGLRIDAEEPNDWIVLQAIVQDASGRGVDLASRMGDLIGEEAGAEDWDEYVVPDLREIFQDQLHEISTALQAAIAESNGGAGAVWIKADKGFLWYGALNQARLAIEENINSVRGTSSIKPVSHRFAVPHFSDRNFILRFKTCFWIT